jgi:hypothetical protein
MTAARTHEAQVTAGETTCPACATTLAAPHDARCLVWGLPPNVSPALLFAVCDCRGDDGHTTTTVS